MPGPIYNHDSKIILPQGITYNPKMLPKGTPTNGEDKTAISARRRAVMNRILQADILERVPFNITDNYFQHYYQENPDPILQIESRKSYGIYDDMDIDAVIGTCWEIIESTITGMEWDVIPSSEDKEDVNRAEFIQDALHRVNGNLWKGNTYFGGFSTALITIVDSMKMGLSFGQAIWNLAEGRIAEIRHEIPHAFYFYPDEQEYSQFRYDWTGTDLYFKPDAQTNPIPAPPYKFMHFVYRGKYGNPYGRSMNRRAYWPYIFGFVEGMKSWVHFIERMGDPWLIGMIDDDHWDDTEYIEEFMKLMKGLQRSYISTLPKGKDGKEPVMMLEGNRLASNEVFSNFVSSMNRLKAVALVGSPLLVLETEFGTRAQATVANEAVFQNLIKGWADHVMAQMQIPIQWMCDLKYGAVAHTHYPTFKLKYEPPANLVEDIKIDSIMVTKVPMSKTYWYEHYGRPVPKDKSDVVFLPEELNEKKRVGSRKERFDQTARVQVPTPYLMNEDGKEGETPTEPEPKSTKKRKKK